jgi:hypothetical protein
MLHSTMQKEQNLRKYIKLSLAADILQQIICTIKIRRAPTRHDTIDFRPLIAKTSEILALSVVTGVGLIFIGIQSQTPKSRQAYLKS